DESAPSAVGALQAQHPFASALNRFAAVRFAADDAAERESLPRPADHGGVVEIRIMRVRVLERPAAGTNVRPLIGPIADGSEYLPRFQPAPATAHGRARPAAADLQQRLTREDGIPYRRYAGLAIRFLAGHDEELVDGFSGH